MTSTQHTPHSAPHTWTQTPNTIYADFGQMETAELRCTLVLIRETYGYHRQATNLTYDDFLRLTAVKSKATIGAGLKAVAKRGYFKQGGRRSQWIINSQIEPGGTPNRSIIEPDEPPNRSENDPYDVPNRSENDLNDTPNRSIIEPFHYNKERSPSGKKRERERKRPSPPATPPPATRHPKMPLPNSTKECELAAHPAAAAWLESGAPWPGWQRLELITQRLGPVPQAEALRQARDLWLLSGYRPANINGILDWYAELCHDPHWQPHRKPASSGRSPHTQPAPSGPQDPTMEMLLRLKAEATCT